MGSNLHDHEHHNAPPPILRWIFWGFGAIAAFFLITEHAAHVFRFLPFLLILACPLMHIFGHGGHGHGGGHSRDSDQDSDSQASNRSGNAPGAGHQH